MSGFREWIWQWKVPLLVFAVIWAHGSWIGLTDDEAYYWVLAQRPDWGYAYHPPMVAWLIALSEALFGWVAGPHSVALVRLPAALCAAGVVALGIYWLRLAGVESARASGRGALTLVSLVGLFSLSWMMVPDLPLFLGWMVAFVATWTICFRDKTNWTAYVSLIFGIAFAILSKYSGVLAAVSAGGAILLWAPRDRRIRGWLAVGLGGVIASGPILYWNATHEWASILYQISERHGGAHVSLVRYLRFWVIELILAGPGIFIFGVWLGRRWLARQTRQAEVFAGAWAAPGALVFCTQPLWADFKPHWALIVWWPLALSLAWAWGRDEGQTFLSRLGRIQVGYALFVGAIVLVSCHYPVTGWFTQKMSGHASDPRLDVTNDLYGWSELRAELVARGGEAILELPVIGGRYQTASQAAFAMGPRARVTMLPRDRKAMDEWPDLSVSAGQGPAWPRLTRSVLFVGDNRYDAAPEFPGARCEKLWTIEKQRFGLQAKTILVWKCDV